MVKAKLTKAQKKELELQKDKLIKIIAVIGVILVIGIFAQNLKQMRLCISLKVHHLVVSILLVIT